MKKKKKEIGEGYSSVNQIQDYLKQNQSDHYNFEEERDYTVSSGSLKLDIEWEEALSQELLELQGLQREVKLLALWLLLEIFKK